MISNCQSNKPPTQHPPTNLPNPFPPLAIPTASPTTGPTPRQALGPALGPTSVLHKCPRPKPPANSWHNHSHNHPNYQLLEPLSILVTPPTTCPTTCQLPDNPAYCTPAQLAAQPQALPPDKLSTQLSMNCQLTLLPTQLDSHQLK